MRRTTRDWIADISLFLFAVCFLVLTADSVVVEPELSPGWLLVEQGVGGLACAALFLRRRWPVQLAVLLLVIAKFTHFAAGPTMVALFTVAVLCRHRTTGWVALLAFAQVPVFLALGPDPDDPATASAITYFALLAGAFGWGLFVRSRRQLVESLRDRADRAGVEARRQAREDIAREMHDVLAHRLSLLSVHAGALEFNPEAPGAEVQRAAGVIRESAHQALDDLREIIGVLRAPEDAGRPQPVLADLERLAEESRSAGMRVTLHQGVGAPADAPVISGRTAYRIVQEGLTNARKHAPGAPVTVTVGGGPDTGLSVEVRNPLLGGGGDAGSGKGSDGGSGSGGDDDATEKEVPAIPGGGQGLIGLAERASLAGGRVEHGRAGGDFRLFAWLPWPA